MFRYIWNRTSKRFRAEASQYFQLMRTCQKQRTELWALTLWFGDKEVPVDLDAAEVTSMYLAGVIKSLERKLMSRTGGLLELQAMSPSDGNTHQPENFHVDYMHRTANDWVLDNWLSITSATDPDFDPFFWLAKGQALILIVTNHLPATRPPGDNHWQTLFYLASRVPDDHSERGILVAALNRLDDHIISHMAERYESPDLYWVDSLTVMNAPRVNDHSLSRLPSDINLNTPFCTNFLELSARIPMSAYLKKRVQDDPDVFPTADYYLGVVRNAVFGEIWFWNPKQRLDLLDFLLQEKYGPWLERLRSTKAQVEDAIAHSASYPIADYFTQVANMLESRIPQPASQTSQGIAAVHEGGRNSEGTTIASDPRHKAPKSKVMNGVRVSIRKVFGRKQG